VKLEASPTNHLACTRGWKEDREDRKEKASEEARVENQGEGGGRRGAAGVAVHSVASIMQRHGVFAFP